MKLYSISSDVDTPWIFQLMSKVDSYLFLGGNRIKVVSIVMQEPNLIIGKVENVQISTIVKILKILSFLIFPLILIALALHYFLHAKYAKYANHLLVSKILERAPQYVPIPGRSGDTASHYKLTTLVPVSQKNLQAMGSNPLEVEAALRTTKPSFFCVPAKYRQIIISSHGIRFSLDLEQLADDINLDSVSWPTEYLNSTMDFCSKADKRVIQNVQNLRTGTYINSVGKRSLLKFMLQHLFIDGITQENPEALPNNTSGRLTLFPSVRYIYSHFTPQNPTIWPQVFFRQGPLDEDRGGGFEILEQLQELGVRFPICPSQGPDNPNFQGFQGIRIYWEDSYQPNKEV
uniref:Uncharacterized protein n=1 Tax=Chlamydia pneumoniae TaxID=83558 RepID=A0A0F7X144_CHLPN|nr:Uncharacterized protein BN1224_DC9_AT_00030 [Chlamydia pneumoniae]